MSRCFIGSKLLGSKAGRWDIFVVYPAVSPVVWMGRLKQSLDDRKRQGPFAKAASADACSLGGDILKTSGRFCVGASRQAPSRAVELCNLEVKFWSSYNSIVFLAALNNLIYAILYTRMPNIPASIDCIISHSSIRSFPAPILYNSLAPAHT